MICSKPICLLGQPSALANGSHIAITSGVRTIDGLSSGASGRSASKLSKRPHSEEAGDHTTGSSRPSAILVCASPLETTSPSTKARPSCWLNSRISGSSSFSFSGEKAKLIRTAPSGARCASFCDSEESSPPPVESTATTATATAASSAMRSWPRFTPRTP